MQPFLQARVKGHTQVVIGVPRCPSSVTDNASHNQSIPRHRVIDMRTRYLDSTQPLGLDLSPCL